MSMEELEKFQEKLFLTFGMKIDIHHSEKHRAFLVVPHGKPLTFQNVIFAHQY